MTGSADLPGISVVVPVYRNQDSLRELHRRLDRALEGLEGTWELLLVDDASPDDGLEILRELAGEDPRVAAVALAERVGQHRAVMIGLGYARGERAVVMDADLQDPPEAIPDLLRKLQAPTVAVFAGRRGSYQSLARMLTSRLFKGLMRIVAGLPRGAGGFVAMDRSMATHLLALEEPRPYLAGMIACSGLPLAVVPVPRDPRPHGPSGYRWGDRWRLGAGAVMRAVLHWRRGVGSRVAPLPEPRIAARWGVRFFGS